ncbi:pimeloyl-ACP methyl ester carboxylesterase [Amycolatopsis lexingtonensis]|uniref:Pimeloyl-ACP methyl ester carboxylesterase n=1 Tax=Amycolatopsis lexingtonensis TaxID=218822 RepID=A0ABR9HTL4_9PSEU|nr:alpha/beta fold hydrolase [Amycolatopsis lexingtonensis]MBE1494122.1 pimeloyl-ACP methyl ester carboxylesterase [Amycolatopsis lexingtonensis]
MTTPCRHRCGFTDDPSTYYEVFEPLEPNGHPPVLMVTGGVHSGACYHVTPDGHPGWADDFLGRGHTVVLADWPGVGRSGHVPPGELTGQTIVDGLAAVIEEVGGRAVVLTHSIGGAFGWKLAEQHPDAVAAVIGVAPAPPGNLGAELGHLVRDEGSRKVVAMPSGETTLDLDGTLTFPPAFHRAKLVGSSTRFPRETLDAYFRSLQGISGRIVFERTNIGGAQLHIEDESALEGKHILVVTGTEDIDHPRELDGAVVEWLKKAGARAEQCWLGDRGITGNGHMTMLENNSTEIAGIMLDWLETALKA